MARKRRAEEPGRRTDATGVPASAKAASISRAASSNEVPPKEESTRRRAHEIYERRKALGLQGDAAGDWLQAEAELGSQAEPRP